MLGGSLLPLTKLEGGLQESNEKRPGMLLHRGAFVTATQTQEVTHSYRRASHPSWSEAGGESYRAANGSQVEEAQSTVKAGWSYQLHAPISTTVWQGLWRLRRSHLVLTILSSGLATLATPDSPAKLGWESGHKWFTRAARQQWSLADAGVVASGTALPWVADALKGCPIRRRVDGEAALLNAVSSAPP